MIPIPSELVLFHFMVHWGGFSCKRHSSGQMVHILALEIQHIVNSLTENPTSSHLPRLARGKLVHFHGWKSLALSTKTTKLCILTLGTFPGNLSSKELEKELLSRTGSERTISEKNGVCEISQTPKRAAKYFHNTKLSPKGCEVGFHLETLQNASFNSSDWLVTAATSSFQLELHTGLATGYIDGWQHSGESRHTDTCSACVEVMTTLHGSALSLRRHAEGCPPCPFRLSLRPIMIPFLHVGASVILQCWEAITSLGQRMDGQQAQQTEVTPPPAMVVVPTSEDTRARMDKLEQKMRQMRESDGGMGWDDFDGLPVANLSAKFRMP
ncbi:hypothetical protein AAG906_030874 [Vitis piasezkii]